MTRLVSAELLKLRRNRAVWAAGGAVAILLPVALLLMTYALDDTRVGGVARAGNTFEVLLGPGLIGAAMIGVSAGSLDREAGVLRSLASAGSSRTTLFLARIPAVLIATLVLSVAAWAVTAGIGTVIHVGTDAVTLGWAIDWLPSLLVGNVVIALAMLGLCTAGMSGALGVGFILALLLGIVPIMTTIEATPDWMLGLMPPVPVTELFGGSSFVGAIPIPAGWAVLGIGVWTVGLLVVGHRRLLRAEL
ncbi:MAG: ABC transporter permease [Patulibacter sp.]|nr:ABC transporter permease [Patulibacter sp.]